MTDKLTDSLVKALKPGTSNRICYDSLCAGFGVRITKAGSKSFVLNYRTRAGRERRWTIGKHPDWSVSAARAEAKRLKAEVRANGADPVGKIEAERDAPTMADLAARYLEQHAPKKRASSQRDDARMLRTFVVPALGQMKVSDVCFSDCDNLHRKITRQGKGPRANRVIALLSKAFNLSIKWGWRLNNPCKGIERNQENKRTRYLSGDELARLTKALAEFPDQQAANAIRLLLLTGARAAKSSALDGIRSTSIRAYGRSRGRRPSRRPNIASRCQRPRCNCSRISAPSPTMMLNLYSPVSSAAIASI
jgi:hypothetical protein